jgi:HSP20 family molecular chaperone IbpA
MPETSTTLNQRAESTSPAEVAEEAGERPVAAPAVDIFENPEGYLVLADLPGVTGEAIDVRFEGGELRLSARREVDEAGRVAGEFRAVDYRRAFKIPEDVDTSAIDATLDRGVLRLHLPRAKTTQPRKIAVRASA